MARPVITIDELAKINPQFEENPPDWTADAAQRRYAVLRGIVESVLGEVQWVSDAGVCTSEAGCGLPAAAKRVPQNEYIGVNLSKFDRLFTITYPWDVKAEILERLVTKLEDAGFRYVPFTLFANPANYRWEYAAAFTENMVPPPAGQHTMRHEDVWRSLFDYP